MSQWDLAEKAFQHLGDEFQAIGWTIGIFALLLSPVTVIGNGLVLASIILDPFNNIRSTPSSNLIFSLALADFIVGIFSDPLVGMWLIFTVTNNSQPFSSSKALFPTGVLVLVSLSLLVALSVDRRIAITTPLQYAYRVTKTKIRIAIVSIWCYYIFVALLLTVFHSTTLTIDMTLTVHLAIASIALIVLNIAAIRSVHNQGVNIKRNVRSANSLVLKNAFNREKTVTQAIIVMVVVFEICLLPFIILSSIADKILKMSSLQNYKTLIRIYFLASTLLLANSLMNPFLYAWRLSKYRKAFQYILRWLKEKLSTSQVQPQNNSCGQLSVTTVNNIRLEFLNLSPLEQRDNNIKTWRQEAVSCCITSNMVDIQDCIGDNEGNRMEDTCL